MKKYNKDNKNITVGFSDGGMPLLLNDLLQLETNTYLSGITSVLRGFSCVLQGCIISNVNTTTKKLDISEGLVMIDDIIYNTTAITNQTYPFSFVHGNVIPDTRGFKVGGYKDVGNTYEYSVKTSFTWSDIVDIYPILTTSEIYFDPFTAQKASYILNNLGKQKGECIIKNISTTTILKDETNQNLVGTVNWLPDTLVPKYAYYGYHILTETGKLTMNNSIGSLSGSDNISLTEGQIPQHYHTSDGLIVSPGGIHRHEFENAFYSENVPLMSNLYKNHHYPTSQFGTSLIANVGSGETDYDNTPIAFRDMTYNNPSEHVHGLTGITGSTSYLLTPGNAQQLVDISGKQYGVSLLEWKGYPTTHTIPNVLSSNGLQVVSYKFWNFDIPFINM